jgi:hypothetical protein
MCAAFTAGSSGIAFEGPVAIPCTGIEKINHCFWVDVTDTTAWSANTMLYTQTTYSIAGPQM